VKPKLLIGILVVLIALNLATIGSFFYVQWKRSEHWRAAPAPLERGYPPRALRGERRDPGDRPLFRLNSEDRLKLRKQLSDYYQDTAELRDHVRELEIEAFALMERDTVPRSELDSLLADISATRFEIRRVAVDKLIESKDYLSPQQQKHFFRAILETHDGRHMGKSREHGSRRGQDREKRRGDRN
jgi:uncharacterized membrane protein